MSHVACCTRVKLPALIVNTKAHVMQRVFTGLREACRAARVVPQHRPGSVPRDDGQTPERLRGKCAQLKNGSLLTCNSKDMEVTKTF